MMRPWSRMRNAEAPGPSGTGEGARLADGNAVDAAASLTCGPAHGRRNGNGVAPRLPEPLGRPPSAQVSVWATKGSPPWRVSPSLVLRDRR